MSTIPQTELTHRHYALLRAVGAGRCELTCSREPDLFIDGRTCCDQTAAHLLAHAGLIRHAEVSVSSILNHSMRSGLAGKLVPDGLRAAIQEYVNGYVLHDHVGQVGSNSRRMDELGLTDYALRRFALAGTPGDWIARIEELADAGATKLWISLRGTDLDQRFHELDLLGTRVMPHFVS